jgi:short subunit dehydrogenase-like uncharacterized protein
VGAQDVSKRCSPRIGSIWSNDLQMTPREYDLILLGATGFTGRLVAGHLAGATARERRPLRWALAGRNRDKLAAVAKELGEVPVLIVDALDPAGGAELARKAKVVCTTVGPYAKYGSAVVAACAEAGTHYCDLTGEVHWMRAMIDAHHERARQSGARIVHACGFDSIPSDLGTWAFQQEHIRRSGAPASRVTALFGETRGGISGGSVASGFAIAEAMQAPATRRTLRNPYGLDPDPDAPRPPAPDVTSIGWDARLRMFTIPFFMAPTNSRVVRRAHALAGFPWGRDFVYREVMSTPGNALGLGLALGITGGLAAYALAMRQPRLRAMLQKRAPQPGAGPDERTRARGHWKVRFVDGEGRLLYVAADPAGDPGYASTARMLGESALCLANDELTSPGGVQTPSVAMGAPLLDRLRAAGLTFAPAS